MAPSQEEKSHTNGTGDHGVCGSLESLLTDSQPGSDLRTLNAVVQS